MADIIKVGIVGAGGRMGRLVAHGLHEDSDFEVACLYDPKGGELEGIAKICTELDELLNSSATHIVDFSTGKAVDEQGEKILLTGKRYLVGTTGYSQTTLEKLKDAAQSAQTSCLVVPNFSIGANLMMLFSKIAGRLMPCAEIVEAHHKAKVDAPSGTAIATAKLISHSDQQTSSEKDEPSQPARGQKFYGINVHSIRIDGVLAEQRVIFGALDESLIIEHKTVSRKCYLQGVKLALKKLSSFQGLKMGLLSVLELEGK